MSWYRQSTNDRDTHRGTLSRGSVNAACGIRFTPQRVAFGRTALSGEPVDADRYLYRGQPFPAVSLVAVALQELEQGGMLALAESDEHGLTTVTLTETGLARYKALDQRQRARPDPPGTGP